MFERRFGSASSGTLKTLVGLAVEESRGDAESGETELLVQSELSEAEEVLAEVLREVPSERTRVSDLHAGEVEGGQTNDMNISPSSAKSMSSSMTADSSCEGNQDPSASTPSHRSVVRGGRNPQSRCRRPASS